MPSGAPPEFESSGSLDKEKENRIEAIAEEYLEALQAGAAPDLDGVVKKHPDLALWLERRLRLVELLFRATDREHDVR